MLNRELGIVGAIERLGGEATLPQIHAFLISSATSEDASTVLSPAQLRAAVAALVATGRIIKAGQQSYRLTFQGREWFINELGALQPKAAVVTKERKRKQFILPVEVEAREGGGYLAICESIQGCHAEGNTVAEALENLEDVIYLILHFRREQELPPPRGLEKYRPEHSLKAQLVISLP